MNMPHVFFLAHGVSGDSDSIIQRFLERTAARERNLSRSSAESDPFQRYTAPDNVVALKSTSREIPSLPDQVPVYAGPQLVDASSGAPSPSSVAEKDVPIGLVEPFSSEVQAAAPVPASGSVAPAEFPPQATPPRVTLPAGPVDSLENTPTRSDSGNGMEI